MGHVAPSSGVIENTEIKYGVQSCRAGWALYGREAWCFALNIREDGMLERDKNGVAEEGSKSAFCFHFEAHDHSLINVY